MKLPCEVVVAQLLPTARGTLAKELVKTHGLTQVEVAKKFDVTSAAISQYINGLRGGNIYIDESRFYDAFHTQIANSASRIMEGCEVSEELCALCTFVKKSGMLDEIYKRMGSDTPLTDCMDCPRKNMA